MDADIFPLASRMPVSMASLLRSDSVKPFRNSSSYGTINRSKNKRSVYSATRPQHKRFIFLREVRIEQPVV